MCCGCRPRGCSIGPRPSCRRPSPTGTGVSAPWRTRCARRTRPACRRHGRSAVGVPTRPPATGAAERRTPGVGHPPQCSRSAGRSLRRSRRRRNRSSSTRPCTGRSRARGSWSAPSACATWPSSSRKRPRTAGRPRTCATRTATATRRRAERPGDNNCGVRQAGKTRCARGVGGFVSTERFGGKPFWEIRQVYTLPSTPISRSTSKPFGVEADKRIVSVNILLFNKKKPNEFKKNIIKTMNTIYALFF